MDTPNANGRTYPKKVVENAFSIYKKDFIDPGRAIVFHKNKNDLDYAYGLVKDYFIEDDSVFIDVKPLTLKDSETFTQLIEAGELHFVTTGVGSMNRQKIIGDDYRIRYIFLDPEPSYIFK